MVSRRAIKGVLRNFLGAYTSRHSDFHGYWLFGFLISNLDEVNINLLTPPTDNSDNPWETAAALATSKFDSQVRKAGLQISQVKDAWLTITRRPGVVAGAVRGFPCTGHTVRFSAAAVMNNHKRYQQELELFVAPHNEKAELRSARYRGSPNR